MKDKQELERLSLDHSIETYTEGEKTSWVEGILTAAVAVTFLIGIMAITN